MLVAHPNYRQPFRIRDDGSVTPANPQFFDSQGKLSHVTKPIGLDLNCRYTLTVNDVIPRAKSLRLSAFNGRNVDPNHPERLERNQRVFDPTRSNVVVRYRIQETTFRHEADIVVPDFNDDGDNNLDFAGVRATFRTQYVSGAAARCTTSSRAFDWRIGDTEELLQGEVSTVRPTLGLNNIYELNLNSDIERCRYRAIVPSTLAGGALELASPSTAAVNFDAATGLPQ